jgi:hypothetical protein
MRVFAIKNSCVEVRVSGSAPQLVIPAQAGMTAMFAVQNARYFGDAAGAATGCAA